MRLVTSDTSLGSSKQPWHSHVIGAHEATVGTLQYVVWWHTLENLIDTRPCFQCAALQGVCTRGWVFLELSTDQGALVPLDKTELWQLWTSMCANPNTTTSNLFEACFRALRINSTSCSTASLVHVILRCLSAASV